jgi:hypothetical protein
MTLKPRHLLASMKGLTIPEMAAILTLTTIAAGSIAPWVQDYVSEVRYQRAVHDTRAIAEAMARFEEDVLGQSDRERGWATFDLLVGAGAAPSVGVGGDSAWVAPLDAAGIGALDAQLVTNAVGYSAFSPRQTDGTRGWRGPYIEAGIGPDPWGHRYAINVRALSSGVSRTVVVSAGPNGRIETAFQGVAIFAGGDDLVAVVAPAR